MIKRHKGTWIAMYICALVSLVLLCSASWFIISLETHPISNVDAEMDAYKIMDADTSGSFNVSKGVIYNGKTYTLDQVKAEIVAAKKTELYGNGAVDISINWKLGYYNDGTTQIENPDEIGKVAGTHYCEIIDNVTGQVIEPKHRVVIGQDELTMTATLANESPLFVGKTVTYSATWTGNTSGTPYDILNDATYTVQEGDFKGNAQLCENVSTPGVELSSLVSGEAYELFRNNYNVAGALAATVEYDILANCYSIHYDSEQKKNVVLYYGSLNQGLTETSTANKSGTTLVAMQSFTYPSDSTTVYTSGTHYNHTISGVKTVGSEVTLIIPYRGTGTSYEGGEGPLESDRYGQEGSLTYDAAPNTPTNPVCVNKVTLSGSLINDGNVQICGIVGMSSPTCGLAPMGSTSGSYAMLYMENATMTVAKTLNVYGYIVNGGNASITAKSGAAVYMPFVIYDHYGGGTAIGDYKKGGISPVSIFDMPNIQVKLTCKAGATVTGYADLFTDAAVSLPAQHNLTDVPVFGTSDALFIMSSGEADFEYTAKQGKDFGSTAAKSKLDASSETNITLKGNTESGDVALTVTVIVSQKVSLTSVTFPVSYKITLNLEGAYKYKFNSSFKFMPGSVLNIGEDAEVEVAKDAKLLIYDKYYTSTTDAGYTDRFAKIVKRSNYYDRTAATEDAQCNVSGTLTVKGYIGGRIVAKSATAIVDLSSAQGLKVEEVEGNGSSGKDISSMLSGGTFDPIYTESQHADGTVLYASDTATENFKTGRTYTSFKKGSSYVWYYDIEITIKYNLIGGTLEGSKGANGVVTKTFNANSKDGLTLGASHLTKPTRAYYKFGADWYTDSGFKTVASGQTTYTDTTYNLYAQWTAIEYTIAYKYKSVGVDATLPSVTFEKFTVETNAVTLPTPTHETYTFTAWYADEGYSDSKRINSSISGKDLLGMVTITDTTNNIVTIYGEWTSITYTVIFSGGELHGGGTTANWSQSYSNFNGVTLPDPMSGEVWRTDPSKQYHFVGWYIGDTKVESLNTDMFTIVDDKPQSLTLTAKWVEKKYTVNIDGSSNADGKISDTTKVIDFTNKEYKIYIDESQLANSATLTLSDILSTYVALADDYDTDTGVNKYFKGWAKSDGTIVTSITASDFTNGSLTLTAKWGTKHKIVLSDPNNTNYTTTIKVDGTDCTTKIKAGTYWVNPSLEKIELNVQASAAKWKYFKSFTISGGITFSETYKAYNFKSSVSATKKSVSLTEGGETTITLTTH